MDFYKFAEAYDLVFSGRDHAQEIIFSEWCFNKHSKIKDQSRTVLEVASGPAHHAKEFARKGWQTSALDISEEMLEYAKLTSPELNINYIQDDMLSFRLDEPVDFITNFNESITHILTNEDFILHLKTVSKNLKPGGIYLIETAHPYYFFPDEEPNLYKIFNGDEEFEFLFGKPDDDYDPVKQIWNLTIELKIKKNGKIVEDYISNSLHRWYLSQELRAFVQLSGEFDEYWFYGSMEVPPAELTDFENSDSMILVLRKK
jgi:SAM-dependent methyltransferase